MGSCAFVGIKNLGICLIPRFFLFIEIFRGREFGLC